jgi:hypothetical protein
MRLLTTAALLLAAVLPVSAQEETPAPSRYAVEVIVFENLDQSRSTPETPVPADPYAVAEPAPSARLATRPELEFLLLAPGSGQPGFTDLPATERRLEAAYQRLERLDAYRPLAYLAWVQPARPRAAAEPLAVAQTNLAAPGLAGHITLFKERFVHLDLDLDWDSWSGRAAPGTGSIPEAPAHIAESRRVRGDTVEYFDHPRFGAITYVRELPEEPQPPATEPAG